MERKTSLLIQLEMIWLLATILILGAVLYPIYSSEAEYPFWLLNTVFVIVFLIFIRYIFLLKHSFLAYGQAAKAAIFILCFPLFFYLFNEMAEFQLYLNEVGLEAMFQHLPMNSQDSMVRYVQSEMLFFGTGSIIVCIIMPVRMMISFWRTHNRGTV